MAALDATILSELATILGESQLPMHRHIDFWRQRRRCLMSSWDLRTAGVDLEVLAMKVFAKNPAALEMIRDPLIAYAEAATSKYVETDRAALRKSLDYLRIMTDSTIAPEQKSAAMKSAFAAAARREIDLARLNAAHVEHIKAALPAPLDEHFAHAHRAEVFPLTYPDLPVSRGYTSAFLASEALTAEHRADIEARWSAQAAALDRLSKQMAEREEQFNEYVSTQRTFAGSDEYSTFMRDRRLQRWLLHQQYLKDLLASYEVAISADQATAIRGTINDISLLIERAKDDHYPMR